MLLMVWDIVPVGSISTNNKYKKNPKFFVHIHQRTTNDLNFHVEYWNLQNKRKEKH
jgi:hypothetical protein